MQVNTQQITTTYLATTIDPLHIGAGGYRLGRVDNTIIREPGTNLPKIPGSSISGVCRNYSIYSLDQEEQTSVRNCLQIDKDKKDNAANNCGKCAICKTFGYANGTTNQNQIGRVKFFDAQLLAFPVSSARGPVWITTANLWRTAGGTLSTAPEHENLVIKAKPAENGKLNIGWLYLPVQQDSTIAAPAQFNDSPAIKQIVDNLVIVPQWLFSDIVNSNLEVRTSVSIDFATGAAEDGALFTYEAIPRAALFTFDVVIDQYRCNDEWSADKVATIVGNGLKLISTLGMGGMNTRGFGRLDIISPEPATTNKGDK